MTGEVKRLLITMDQGGIIKSETLECGKKICLPLASIFIICPLRIKSRVVGADIAMFKELVASTFNKTSKVCFAVIRIRKEALLMAAEAGNASHNF
ncbi:Hypothetical predicted protein [Cloeon dipterum]|uniref:Uncharacterized protein n=1 Tax=Cloeon dipterum TaxID=197152 RepID=A0A8S1E028_9INSE|nr:Hypothetical predicted protein [Cloeon dipterum]